MKKGEKSTPVIYYKILEKRDEAGKVVLREDGKPARIPFVRWANVFNLDQTEGIPAPSITASQSMSPAARKGGCHRGKCQALPDPPRGIRRLLLAQG